MQRISGIVMLLIGGAVLWQGRHLGAGTFRSPGAGFFPDLVALCLMALAVVLIVYPGQNQEEQKVPFSARAASRILVVFLLLLAYAFVLEYLGFLITSFFLMAYLFWAFGSRKWYGALLWASMFVIVAYLLFDVALEGSLPKGVLGI